jgi:hypothetical protein
LNVGEGPGYDKQRRRASDEREEWLEAHPGKPRSAAEAEWVMMRKARGLGGYEAQAHQFPLGEPTVKGID